MKIRSSEASIFVGLLSVVIMMQLWAYASAQRPHPTPPPSISVYFSPKGGCTDAIVKEINAARSELKVHAYSFTSTPIAENGSLWLARDERLHGPANAETASIPFFD